MSSISSKAALHTAGAIATYSLYGYCVYKYFALRNERSAKLVEVYRAQDELELQREQNREAIAKAKASVDEEWEKLKGADRLWKDRLLQYVRTLRSYASYEEQFPQLFVMLNDVAEKLEAASDGLHLAQEKEFIYSKSHVLSLLVSAQRWQEEHGSAKQNIDPKDAKQADDFYQCYNAFLQFLFRSDPYVGAVAQFCDQVEGQYAAQMTAGMDLQNVHQALLSKIPKESTKDSAFERSISLLAAPVHMHHKSLSEKRVYLKNLREAEKDALKGVSEGEEMNRLSGEINALRAQREREVARSISYTALETFQKALLYNLI